VQRLLAVDRLGAIERDLLQMQDNMGDVALAARERRELAEELEVRLRVEECGLEEERRRLAEVCERLRSLHARAANKTALARVTLAEGDPHLDLAGGALELVTRRDLGQLAAASKPPEGVEEVFAALSVLLASKHPHVPVQRSGRVRARDLAWDAVRRGALANVNLLLEELGRFRGYADEGSLPRVNMREVRAYTAGELFRPEVVERRCEVAGALCAWILSMVQYYDVVETVEPLRLEIEVLKQEIAKVESERVAKEKQVSSLEARRDALRLKYDAAEEQSRAASHLAENSERRLELTRKLLAALDEERAVWTDEADRSALSNFVIVNLHSSRTTSVCL
jgi:hypothetical protein